MSFYSPIYFLFMIGLIPIILMYLLKKQHTDIVVSSNYLWEKALKDIEANRPWQRLKKNLLLLLQVLIFTSLVFALTKPYIFSNKIGGGNLILVLDTSASMQSKEEDDTRFNTAIEEVERIISNLKPNTEVTLITTDSKPNIIVNNSNDKATIRDKLRNIEVSNKSDNFDDTISLIKAMTKDMNNYNVVLFTDKEIQTDIDNMVVNIISTNETNVSIDNLSHSENGDMINVLSTVTNHSNKNVTFDISLYTDNYLMDVQEIELEPRKSKDIYWNDIDNKVSTLKAEIDIDDVLILDNFRYHVVINKPIRKAIIISEENIFLEKAIALNDGIDLYKSNEILNNLNGYELYIFDGMMPETLPSDGNIIIFDPPENKLFNIEGVQNTGELKLLNDELFKFVDLNFIIGRVKQLEAPSWATPVLLLDDKPVIFKGQNGKQKFVVCGFDIHNTDLPLKVDFPILIQNMLDYTLNLGRQENISIFSGESIEIDVLPKTEKASIVSPSGNRETIAPPFPLAPYTNTNELGIYKIEQENEGIVTTTYFTSNIDTFKESIISMKENNESRGSENVQKRYRSEKSVEDIFLVIAILLLAVEWVVYARGY